VIVDAQVRIWGADTPQPPWLADGAANAHRPVPFGTDELIREMDAAGMDRVVIVPPSWEGDRNDLALEAARLRPHRSAIMGRLPIEKPESRGLVDGWRQQPGMLGVRLTFHRGPYRSWLTDGTADWLWTALLNREIPIPEPSPAYPSRGRCLRTAPCVLGHGPHATPMPLSPGGVIVHRRTRFPLQRLQRVDYGAWHR
jgi:L-fuconolactonase